LQITSEMFLEWQHSPVTKGLFKALYNEREFLKEGLVSGSFDSTEELKVKGRCETVALILNLTYEELIDSMRESYNGK
jgi:hypothetical protein